MCFPSVLYPNAAFCCFTKISRPISVPDQQYKSLWFYKRQFGEFTDEPTIAGRPIDISAKRGVALHSPVVKR